MAEEVKVTRTIYGVSTFKNVVKTDFSQLLPQESSVSVTPPVDIKGFFANYNDLFYDIPQTGSYSGSLGFSHLDLVNRSSEYIGISFSDLQAEIIQLRSDNVALRNQIFTLTQATSSTAITS